MIDIIGTSKKIEENIQRRCFRNEGSKREKIAESYRQASIAISKLSDAMKFGADLIKHHQELFESHSEACSLAEVQLIGVDIALFFKVNDAGDSEDDFVYSVSFDGCREKWGNSSQGQSLANLIERTGLSADYLQGIVDGVKSLGPIRLREMIEEQVDKKAELVVTRINQLMKDSRKWQIARDAVLTWRAMGDSIFDEDVKETVDDLIIRKYKSELAKSVRIGCSAFDMPPVPHAKCSRNCLTENKPQAFSGVYFCWVGGVCVYVGKSVNVPNRICSHNIIQACEDVSWIEMPEHEIHHAEQFYIWLLRPCRNNESKLALRSKCKD